MDMIWILETAGLLWFEKSVCLKK